MSPLGLYFWGHSWSLAAWCDLRVAYRNFRPDRMRHVELLDEPRHEGCDLDGFVRDMRDRRDAQDHPALGPEPPG